MAVVNLFSAYGGDESLVANYAYLGHFVTVFNKMHSINYALYRRCTDCKKEAANREYFMCKTDMEKRKKAKVAAVSKITEVYGPGSYYEIELNNLYQDINKFFAENYFINHKINKFLIDIPLYTGMLGAPCLESYEKNISMLPIKTASLYILVQRLADIYNIMSQHFQWEDIVENVQ